ncbi:MAG: CPBP family intramembrane metalloprotease [Lachnospiraceae bacterium]|nr:CPBP family intramembrane metalloprotease [Lachnospiraceae bacterium]
MKNIVKALLCFVLYFVIQFAVQIVFMGIGAASGIQDQNGLIDFSMNHLLLITLTANVVTLLLFLLFNKIRKKSIKEEWSMTSVKIKLYVYPSLAAFLLSFAWAFVTFDLSFANAEQIHKSVNFYSDMVPGLGMAMMILALLLAQPVIEEVLCRGMMLNQIRKSFPDWAAIVISAVIFGLSHLMAGGIVLVLGAALMGVLFGIVFVKTKSLYAAVAAHAFANLPDFVMAFLPEISFGVRIVLAVVAAVAAIAIMVWFCRKEQ